MYTGNTMKRIIAQWPQHPRTIEAKRAALISAGVITIMAVAQLFSFDKFIPLLDSFDFPGGLSGQTVAVALAVSGVWALPFLLQMKLSMAMRWVCMVAGWIVAAAWVVLTLRVNIGSSAIENVGLLGASVTLIPGWWAVCVALALSVLITWASWGQWPGHRSKK